jgi:hypothetical protein
MQTIHFLTGINLRNRIQPLTVFPGGVHTKQNSFVEAKHVWDTTAQKDKQILMA